MEERGGRQDRRAERNDQTAQTGNAQTGNAQTGNATLDTRARIMDVALALFCEKGYQRCSLREIAQRLDLSKAAILYHFPSKAHIVAALTEPMVADFEDVLAAAAARPDPAGARWTAIEDALDAYLSHRRLLQVIFQDLTMLAHETELQRLVRLIMRMYEVVAGPNAGLSERVRAVQMMAVLGDPIVMFADVPTERLRAEILAGARLLLGERPSPGAPPATPSPAGVGSAAPRPRRGAGRPSVMDGGKAAAARRMYAAGSHSVTEIATALGVSRATVYRHLRDAEDHGDEPIEEAQV
ncbi:TetR family transcriptional regulator [Actinomadura alba]|uniref:TetR family transcriptional regulator n=1 Tax=Actinomadura alba TaxID=406431 RepID=A0ABR7LMB5_9ACTN|nr:TetR family transcriptional regulator [Actinomadura alba]MBC6465992.1 TetR family transcriptional regulator [Actinomadura alba]